jgi:hypothetical protein
MGRLILLGAIVFALWWLLRWFRTTPPAQVAAVLRRTALYAAIALVILAAATGRLNPIFAALAAAVPVLMRAIHLLRVLPAVQQILRVLGLGGIPGGAAGGQGSGGQKSSIRTRFLEMYLEHATGRMDGRVLEGPFEGRLLSEMDLDDLLALLGRCRAADPQSAAVLEAYLERTHGEDWRDREESAGGAAHAPAGEAHLTREEALAVLGLQPGAGRGEIRAAHRRLMQKLHPDRGGSDYLAAKINEAKRLLLGE